MGHEVSFLHQQESGRFLSPKSPFPLDVTATEGGIQGILFLDCCFRGNDMGPLRCLWHRRGRTPQCHSCVSSSPGSLEGEGRRVGCPLWEGPAVSLARRPFPRGERRNRDSRLPGNETGAPHPANLSVGWPVPLGERQTSDLTSRWFPLARSAPMFHGSKHCSRMKKSRGDLLRRSDPLEGSALDGRFGGPAKQAPPFGSYVPRIEALPRRITDAAGQ